MSRFGWISAISVCVYAYSSAVYAVPIDVKAEYYFGPDMSRNQACENAREAAKLKAISLVTGERVAFDQQMYCSQNAATAHDKKCEVNRHTWMLVEGRVNKSEVVSEVVKNTQGAQYCAVSMVVDVVVPATVHDASFDLRLELNRNSFRSGEPLVVHIQPTAPMYVSIFNWRTAFAKDNVVRLFPNDIDTQNHITQPVHIPSATLATPYQWEMEWLAPVGYDKDMMTEWVMVVATKKPIKWLPVYDMQRFKEKLLEIPADQRRVVHRSYLLLRE
jgi:hypothetical protein